MCEVCLEFFESKPDLLFLVAHPGRSKRREIAGRRRGDIFFIVPSLMAKRVELLWRNSLCNDHKTKTKLFEVLSLTGYDNKVELF